MKLTPKLALLQFRGCRHVTNSYVPKVRIFCKGNVGNHHDMITHTNIMHLKVNIRKKRNNWSWHLQTAIGLLPVQQLQKQLEDRSRKVFLSYPMTK